MIRTRSARHGSPFSRWRLAQAGCRVTLVELTGAGHHAPVFLDERSGRDEAAADGDSGLQTDEVILDAIAAHQPAMAQQ